MTSSPTAVKTMPDPAALRKSLREYFIDSFRYATRRRSFSRPCLPNDIAVASTLQRSNSCHGRTLVSFGWTIRVILNRADTNRADTNPIRPTGMACGAMHNLEIPSFGATHCFGGEARCLMYE